MVGNIIGSYRIERKLGEGGMGAVYMGTDLMLEREVAIKALRADLASQPPVVERFRSEAVTLAKLNHPNIATLYSFFRQGDEFFMVLEYVRGVTLHQLITEQGALPPGQALGFFRQVLDGIQHAHAAGIIHRDIKPGNVMLTESGTLKVLDFGIARILGAARTTKAGHLVGTVEYMSPEQVRGQAVDARSDIYALGILLYEMLTGRVPFNAESEFELMKAQIEEPPPPPRELNAAIPPEVEAALLRALAKDPAARFQTVNEFRDGVFSSAAAPTTMLTPTAALNETPTGIVSNSYATSELSDPSARTLPNLGLPPAAAPPSTEHLSKETRLIETPTFEAPPAAAAHVPPKETRRLSDPRPVIDADSVAATAAAAAPPDADIIDASDASAADEEAPRADGPASVERPVPPQQPPPPAAAVTTLPPAAQSAPRPSFFARLTWVHYAAAGLIVLVMLGLGIAVPLILWAANRGTVSTENPPAAAQPSAEPQAVEAATPEPQILPTATPEEVAQPEPTATVQGEEAAATAESVATPTPAPTPAVETTRGGDEAPAPAAPMPASPGERGSPRTATRPTPAAAATTATSAPARERPSPPKASKGPSSRREDLKKALTEAP